MESRHKRSRSQLLKWVCYALLALLCAVLQTTPGLFQLDAAKPLYLLPLALAVAVFEDAFSGAVFGAVLRYLRFVLPTAALTVPVCIPLFWAVGRIHEEFKIDNGVV